MEDEPDYSYLLGLINQCDDPKKLTTFVLNAQKRGVLSVREAAYKKLKSLIPRSNIKGIDGEFWEMFSTYEDILLQFSKPSSKLNLARARALSEGPRTALAFWVKNGSQAWVFNHLVQSDQENMTAEYLLSQYAQEFDRDLNVLAQNRLCKSKSRVLEVA